MKYHAENAVSSFFYYMWNAWSKEECKVVSVSYTHLTLPTILLV